MITIKPGPIYDKMRNENVMDLILDLFGDKFGSDDPVTAGIVKRSYKNGSFSRYPIMDFDVGYYDPKTGEHVANYLPNGRKLSDREIKYVSAHERGHGYRLDDVDCVMFAERLVDPELWIEVMGWRAAFAKAGENSKDAEIYRGALERYSGTGLEPILALVDKLGEDILQSGTYDNFRNYESFSIN